MAERLAIALGRKHRVEVLSLANAMSKGLIEE
jgi:hypothetical protein